MSYWVILAVVFVVAGGRALEWIWLKPKRLEKILRNLGFRGNSYRLLHGDTKDVFRMLDEAKSSPLPVNSHDVPSRGTPFLVKTIEDYGNRCFFWFGPTPRVIVTDPEMIREILSTKFGELERSQNPEIGKLLLSGILSYEGEKWAKHRKIIRPAFHQEKLKCMLPTFSACCGQLIDRWEDLISSEGFTELEVWSEFQNFTGDVISRTAFGSSYQQGNRIFQLQTEQAVLSWQALRYSYIPGYRFFPTTSNRRRYQIEREVRSILRVMVENREKEMAKGVQMDDLLGYLMDSNLKHSQEDRDSKMTIDEVIDECKLFYFAGQETTSALLTWTVVLLCMYPSWQDRARQEILQLFGKTKPNLDALNHLKIIPMILNEVLRLYSPASNLLRTTNKEIEVGGLNLPKGIQLLLPIILIHRDPKYWGEDAHEFNPERFAGGVSKASKSQMAFFPFSGGPRVCVGQGFAMLEARLALSMILQTFSFKLSPTYTHAPNSIVTLQPQHGAHILFQKIAT